MKPILCGVVRIDFRIWHVKVHVFHVLFKPVKVKVLIIRFELLEFLPFSRPPFKPLEQALTTISSRTNSGVIFPSLKNWPKFALLRTMHQNFLVYVIKRKYIMHLLHHLQNRIKCSRNTISIMRLRIVQHRVITRTEQEGSLHLFLCHATFATIELGRYSYPIVILQIQLYSLTLYFLNLWCCLFDL